MRAHPRRGLRPLAATAVVLGTLAALAGCSAAMNGPRPAAAPGTSAPARPAAANSPTISPTVSAVSTNVYARAGAGMLNDVTRRARPLVYVPDHTSNRVDVVDPRTYKVVERFRVPAGPQHVVPSWDLRTLWVNDNTGNKLTPIDPVTGKPGRSVSVADPYNLYFTPDGKHAIVMAEALKRIDFRNPRTMKLQWSLHVPCRGVNHADFTPDLTAFVVSCEFSGKLLVVPTSSRKVESVVDLNAIKTPGATDPMKAMQRSGPAHGITPGVTAMPQDVRLAPDGRTFLVADMLRNGVWMVDSATFRVRGFLHTGNGAHGIYPSRDASEIFVSNRDEGSISVLDAATLSIKTTWHLPGGGSPDMGGVTADGTQLWLSGRSNSVVYVLATSTGRLIRRIRVGTEPHGLCVWPQPGAFSLGHTGNMR
jgi:DNA-binding beta-propeller fold protein YncE